VIFEDMESWFAKWKKCIGTDDLYAVDLYVIAPAAIRAWLSRR
jgi:hypothetical protein